MSWGERRCRGIWRENFARLWTRATNPNTSVVMKEEQGRGNASSELPDTAAAPHVSSRNLASSPATTFLVAMNVVVAFVLPIAFERDYPTNPIGLGAGWRPLIFSGEWWRLITASFVHIEIFHLVPNMVALWIFGRRMERLLGSLNFVA